MTFMEIQLVVFDLANEHYGVDIGAVEGIIKTQTITAVPRAPHFVEGVTNLRGEVLPVIDLRKRFGLSPEDETKETRIVVMDTHGTKVGMIVDAVSEVLRVSEEAIEPLSPLMATVDSAFIQGIAKVDGHDPGCGEERLIILLDLGKVLSSEEKADLQPLRNAQGEAVEL
jgi:purine-binding chemotaxis protein CheW